ncbi:MAG: hypothetical protein DRP20_05450 [Thermotogae bacterium]|nr:MAG: hypothetical protein DRP20_05450 [Thermotogota bacterium]
MEYMHFEVKSTTELTTDKSKEKVFIELEGISYDASGNLIDDDSIVYLIFAAEDLKKLVKDLKEVLNDGQ